MQIEIRFNTESDSEWTYWILTLQGILDTQENMIFEEISEN